ncbi:MAG: hypothetical protein HGB08_04860 [Candidatus Moranbacteria bacterium]|nr:hypothetical protein [Candidatus Moranbacteria bacterium]
MASQQNPISIYGADQEKISRALDSQNKNIAVEDLLIHTMKDDLETFKDGTSRNSLNRKNPIEEKILTGKQQTSPFLSNIPKKSRSLSEESNSRTNEDIPVRPQGYEIIPESPKKEAAAFLTPTDGMKINWFLVITIFSSIVFISGGAYLWLSSNSKNANTSPETGTEMPVQSEASSSQETSGSTGIVAALSDSQANYMQLDFDSSAASSIEDQLEKYIQLVKNGNYASPIEFDVTDMQNNSVSLDTFLDKMSIGLTPAIRAQLGTTYSLFIFNDTGNARLGLEIASKNDTKLQEELTKEEPSLVKYVRPLLLGLTVPPASSPFASSSYNGAAIRYINFNIGNDISVDYTVFNGKFLIGTSKSTLRSILDYGSSTQPSLIQQ